jgi:preprotein translocase subunit SecD
MKAIRTAIAALLIALAVVTGAPVGVAQAPIACKPFTTELEARSAGAWTKLDIVRDDPSVRAERVQAELKRLGGARLVLEIDDNALRREMIQEARDDVRRAVREARLGSPGTVIIRGDTIEFQPRDGVAAAAVSNAFAPLLSSSVPALVSRSVDAERADRGAVAFAVSDQALAERRQTSEQATIDSLRRRVESLGGATSLVRALDAGRILVITPGVNDPERIFRILPSMARLSFQIADLSADPCAAGVPSVNDTSSTSDFLALRHHGTKASVLVQRRVVASGEDVAAADVVRDRRTGTLAVALRFNTSGMIRLAKASAENIGRAVAITLDSEVIAARIIREPISDGSILLSGDFSLEQAKELVAMLRLGRSLLPLTTIEQQIFEPRR